MADVTRDGVAGPLFEAGKVYRQRGGGFANVVAIKDSWLVGYRCTDERGGGHRDPDFSWRREDGRVNEPHHPDSVCDLMPGAVGAAMVRVEGAARAICAARHLDPDAPFYLGMVDFEWRGRYRGFQVRQDSVPTWQCFVDDARAVLEFVDARKS